jgi:hypothetical protein
MLTEKIWIFTKIYKLFDPSFSPICYYLFIFGLLQIFIGLSVFRFVANEYKWIAIWSLLTICTIRSGIRWTNPKVKKPTINHYLVVMFMCFTNQPLELGIMNFWSTNPPQTFNFKKFLRLFAIKEDLKMFCKFYRRI